MLPKGDDCQRETLSAALDSLLAEWHQWQRILPVRGFPTRSLVTGEHVTSRQYDDFNGALDAALEQRTMKAVDFQVSQMAEPHKSAIYANARALAVGAAVFSSPRLPIDRAERRIVISEARSMLIRLLQSAGVL